jgi:hypothetical protein
MSKPNLARLGRDLDNAERAVSAMWAADKGSFTFSPDSVSFEEFERIMQRHHDAELVYGQAMTDRSRAAREKFKARKRAPRSRDAFRLREKLYEAGAHLDEIIECRPELATLREFIDAQAAFNEADAIYDYAEAMYNSEESASRRRDAAYRFAVSNHSRPVTDGYVKTGKFKMIDGERVPVLEKIE